MTEAEGAQRPAEPAAASPANIAAALAAVAVGIWAVLVAIDADGPIWLLVGASSLAAAVMGWRAGGGTMPRGRALAALVIGTVLFVMFVVFTILEA